MIEERSFLQDGAKEMTGTIAAATGIVSKPAEVFWERTKESRHILVDRMLHTLRRGKSGVRYGRSRFR